jgi:hypothetical protein
VALGKKKKKKKRRKKRGKVYEIDAFFDQKSDVWHPSWARCDVSAKARDPVLHRAYLSKSL